ncbi:MAG TPA: RluA family pseudouridine synthase [Thermohalobaculum sp.]|nr:RluA family pseudouridine synthase [Thermohalobaculum sp.]
MVNLPDGNGDAPVEITITYDEAGQRLDKALALLAVDIPGLSRSRIAQLIADGAVTGDMGETVTETKRKVKVGETFTLDIPPPQPIDPQPENIPLTVIFEDADLIVIDKPAGMVVHPAPGAVTGTLVNALLHHCGDSLSGIGGALRPGIVHRIDKLTSGLLVVAKSDAAHSGLSALFAAHDIERRYLALAWSAPSRADPRLAGITGVSFEPGGWVRIEAAIARHPNDRKRMAVAAHGRHAVTRLRAIETFGPPEKPFASLLECRLETGRTHQIRVHATYAGHALIGDPAYGRPRVLSEKLVAAEVSAALHAFPRQALHAATLGFCHPVTGQTLAFEAPPPQDLHEIIAILQRNDHEMR